MMGSRFLRQLDLHDLLSLDQDSRPYPAIRRSPESWGGLGNEATYSMYMYFTYIRVFKVRTCTFSQVVGPNPTSQTDSVVWHMQRLRRIYFILQVKGF